MPGCGRKLGFGIGFECACAYALGVRTNSDPARAQGARREAEKPVTKYAAGRGIFVSLAAARIYLSGSRVDELLPA